MIVDIPIELITDQILIIICALAILFIGYCLGVYTVTKLCFHLWFIKFYFNKFKVDLSDEDYSELADYITKMIKSNGIWEE
jgi:hypothetical protein